ncbi:outer membrane beta-barrel protein [Deinococcus detaillensis]|uniref:Outer membrane beta-barrel protein n=1 Tax=Deinococcus detaillensis TaxID=2592048 RepID=A0A553V2V3_9DEIO|nr:outer membrane beta-barrel protein [Deinococcus detaillensis]TSA86752.1 outer membrane beta-barrel protein [Deinococcus detaillensis]
MYGLNPPLKTLFALLCLTLPAASAQAAPAALPFSYTNFQLGLLGGYADGRSVQVFANYNNLAGPLGLRLSVGRSSKEGGFDEDADLGLLGTLREQRKSGLISSERASALFFGLGATYDLGQQIPGLETSFYGGLRYGRFNSRLTYKGGQYTDYSSSALGVGLGSQAAYLLTNSLSVVGDVGVDQYSRSGPIVSRDDRNNTDTFKPGEGGYDTINKAVKRPGTVLKVMLGVRYSF